ncbi:helix-turn-helix domain-containing protein [Streptomyces griseofuscus]|uniref:helix-turn-helix domain-containing protein n=1 Tax=Streptomyces griseofuscus TaxID=146922 RepID=UPI0033C0228D
MARPEKPLGRKSPLVELAAYLREGRLRKGLTYSELAKRARDYSDTTLQRAASGQRLPRREVVRAYALACGLDLDQADQLWETAYREKQRVERGLLPPTLSPRLVSSFADLSVALVGLHARSGAPSLRLMHKRARQRAAECTPLSTSALHRVLSRTTVPASENKLRAFLIGCDVPLPHRQPWERALLRAQQHRQREIALANEAMTRLERRFSGGNEGCVSPEKGAQLLRGVGLDPIEPYRGFHAPWTARCLCCKSIVRVRLSGAVQGQGACPVCR